MTECIKAAHWMIFKILIGQINTDSTKINHNATIHAKQ